MALQPGEIIDGKYRIVRLVGEGGMGAVYEGENTRIKRRVAIKVLHAAVAEKTDVVQRFEREAQAAGTIGSEHIVEVLDLGNLPSGERFMVMEFLEGEDLTGRIKRLKRLTPAQCVPLMCEVLEGLAAAHDAGIIHRDLKPDNIYILDSKAGRADFVKILDFGVSKFSALDNEMSMTRTGAVMGTPYYMSPEQAKGGQIDARSDLYAMGVVLYQMVTGRVPFNAGSFNELLFKIALESPEPVEQIVPDCPKPFIDIINRAMAREVDDRFQSAREFQQVLQAYLASGGRTEALPQMPDMRAQMGSYPHAGASMGGASMDGAGASMQGMPGASMQGMPGASMGGGLQQSSPGFHAPHLGGSQPGIADPTTGVGMDAYGSNPQLHQSGGPVGLSTSQSALAVTQEPKSGRSGMMVAALALVVLLLGGGGVGAYMLTQERAAQASNGETDAQGTNASDGKTEGETPTDDGKSTDGDATTEAKDGDTTPEGDAEGDAVVDLDGAGGSEAADGGDTDGGDTDGGDTDSGDTNVQPKTAANPTPRPNPQTFPRPQPKTLPPPPTQPKTAPQPQPGGGRKIKTEL